MTDDVWRYIHGHAEPVLRSHTWRTVDNSAAYLLPHLRDGQDVLDVGCGPATITADLASRFPTSTVLGIDPAMDSIGAPEGPPANLTLQVGDIMSDELPADRFDVVHAHQVLQHLADPVEALRQMRRVCRPGGLVAVRDADYAAMTWAPAMPELDTWLAAYRTAHLANGTQPDAGRHLLAWTLQAGFTEVTPSASVWCFATPQDRRWWGGLWADRTAAPESALHRQLLEEGHDSAALTAIADAWRDWAEDPAAWFAVLHGEVLARA